MRTDIEDGYADMSARMLDLAKKQPGFLGVESAREQVGITVSYWTDRNAIKQWRDHPEHRKAQFGDGGALKGSAIDPEVIARNHNPADTWDSVLDYQMMSRNVRGFMSLLFTGDCLTEKKPRSGAWPLNVLRRTSWMNVLKYC